MDNQIKPREQWGSRVGFVLAAVGSAVGLGNIWRFPYRVGENGGAAYLIVYLAIVATIGVTVMLAELSIGRKTQLNPVGAFKALSKRWAFVGAIGVLAGFMILSFYSVIGGWTIAYIYRAITGAFSGDTVDLFVGLISNPGEPIIFHGVFMLITMGIVYFGVSKGIEKATKILMPTLFIMLLLVVVRSVTLKGAGAGLTYYLNPDFSLLTPPIILQAVGQAFFSLSLGMGAMITYGSYVNKKENLANSAVIIPALDTLIAFIAGLAILPAVFAFGNEPGAGPALMFITLPGIFAQMPLGGFFGFIFFVLVFFAAVTSAISLLEVVVAYVTDQWKWDREKTTIIMGIIIFLLGGYSSLSTGVTEHVLIFGKPFLDFVADTSDYLLIIGGFFTCVFVGWVWGPKRANEEISNGGTINFKLFSIWTIMVKYVVPILLLAVFILVLIGYVPSLY